MKEQLVSFETAKLAKEKGFDVLTTYKWVEEHPILKSDPKLLKIEGTIEDKAICYTPTQSLLQRWLREVHKIYVLINYIDNDQFNWELNGFQHGEYGIGFRGTYEEALEKGLYQALKLIKNNN